MIPKKVGWGEDGPSNPVKLLIAGICTIGLRTQMDPIAEMQAYCYVIGALLANHPQANGQEKLSMLQEVHDMIDETYGRHTKGNNAQTQASS